MVGKQYECTVLSAKRADMYILHPGICLCFHMYGTSWRPVRGCCAGKTPGAGFFSGVYGRAMAEDWRDQAPQTGGATASRAGLWYARG